MKLTFNKQRCIFFHRSNIKTSACIVSVLYHLLILSIKSVLVNDMYLFSFIEETLNSIRVRCGFLIKKTIRTLNTCTVVGHNLVLIIWPLIIGRYLIKGNKTLFLWLREWKKICHMILRLFYPFRNFIFWVILIWYTFIVFIRTLRWAEEDLWMLDFYIYKNWAMNVINSQTVI